MKTRLFRIMAILLIATMLLLTFTACGDDDSVTPPDDSDNTAITPPPSDDGPKAPVRPAHLDMEIPETFIRLNAEGKEDASGEYIIFGSYPQTEVTDASLKTALTAKAGTLPAADNAGAWTSYGYVIKFSVSDYMWYIDIEHEGNNYRGVYFTSYRPFYLGEASTAASSIQDENGYKTGEVYWFKYEPMRWRILTEANGEALVISDLLIDSREFSDTDNNRTIDENTVYPNNYKESSLRAWLNSSFYDTAFTASQKALVLKTAVDNSVESTGYEANPYVCENTEDFVFLPSYKEITTAAYGFSAGNGFDTAREKKLTDYAKCQGGQIFDTPEHNGSACWWIRSPYYWHAKYIREVDYGGVLAYTNEFSPSHLYGVCPSLTVKLK